MDRHIHLPPMPKPEDFGIDYSSWLDYQKEETVSAGYARVKAYYAALEAWKEVSLTAASNLIEH